MRRSSVVCILTEQYGGFCSPTLFEVKRGASPPTVISASYEGMSWSLLDVKGHRKYLTSTERLAYIEAAVQLSPSHAGAFCLTLALTGVRISEALYLTIDRVDVATCTLVIETLKRRKRGIFRAIPVPQKLITLLCETHRVTDDHPVVSGGRIWPVSRTTAWKWVKRAMRDAGIAPSLAQPKALRHTFAVEAARQRIALSLIKKWLGHARIETTAIYVDPVGEEERALASLTWEGVPLGTHNKCEVQPLIK
jgi:integrase/recombinase XerD